MPDPAIQLFQYLLGLGQLEIRHPATKDRVEFVDDCRQAATARAFEHFAKFVFQPFQTGRRNLQLRGLVRREAVTQKLPRPRMRYRALGYIPTPLDVGSTEVPLGTLADLPGYDAPTFTLMPVGFTSRRSVQVSGFDDICRLTPPCRLVSASCSSGQRFAFGFLQIPSRPEHPCRSANSSPCRASRGLPPPSECALPGAQSEKARATAGS